MREEAVKRFRNKKAIRIEGTGRNRNRTKMESRALNKALYRCLRQAPVVAGARVLALRRTQPLLQVGDFAVQPLGKATAEFGEVFLDQRHFGPPALDVDTEQLHQVGS